MNQRQHRLLRILIPLILFILGCPASPSPDFASNSPTNGVTIIGETSYLAPESQSNLLIHVQNPITYQPQVNGRVQVMLNPPDGAPNVVFEGQTDANGLVHVTFDVPATVEDPNQVLTILAETETGEAQQQNEVYVGRVYDVLISTDKPVYQPGQTIHLRGLALDTTALKAADAQALVFTVEDPSGNKLMRQEAVTSQYGIASANFVLGTQATSGDYIITAELGPVRSTRSVEVKPYTLPRFKINFQSDKAYYLPGEVATGAVDAQYFFGKPVANGQVTIKGYATDVERFQVFEVSGVADDTGFYSYEFQVPDYFVGQLENDTAQVDLEITVVDTANHAETIDENVTVADKIILVEAVPESGILRPGVENVVYLHASYPDGRDAQAVLAITSSADTTHTVQTDIYGLATITLTVQNNRDVTLHIHASDAGGQEETQHVTLGTSRGGDAVLLRPDKAEYAIGETMNVDIYVAGNATTAYLDIIKGRQTFGLVALPVTDGVAQAALDIDGSLLGTLELNAYVITNPGEIVRDRRLVLVNPAPAEVTVEADAEVYRPGDTAQIDITVSREGAPMRGALGVSIVDESVFSVGAQDPGFARTYFLLERELQEPRYEIHDFAPFGADDPSPYDKETESVRIANCELRSEYCAGIASGGSDAQQVALAGFFAEELALMASQEQAIPATGDAVAQSKIQNPESQIGYGWAMRLPLVLPLVGLAFYDGTLRRRRALLGLMLFSLASFFYAACAAAPAAAPAAGEAAAPAAETAAEAPASETTATRGQASQPPRLRQFFPETLFWLPELETDADGHAQIDVPIADSITTWRVSVLASDQDGNLGSAEVGMRVFQDFFVEPDLPRFLTVGDELDVPVSVFNYLDEAQSVQLTVEEGSWFELVTEPVLTLEIGPNEVAAVYIPIRVTGFGANDFQITATGSQMSDAVLRQVEVLPDGKHMADVLSGKLSPNQDFAVTVPANAVPGASGVTIKIYPGIVSQVLDGLEGMLQQPYGCFEQTSSTTYPNVLVLDYLKTTGQIHPHIQLQAEEYINLGYQRLLSFEVSGFPGGFSLFGDPPPQTMLTAYGLNEFSDMSQVSYVDPALIERTASFLFQRQQADGSWNPEGMTIESGLENMGEGNLLATAYIAAALADAGYANSEPVQRAIGYLELHLDDLLNRPVSGMPGQNASASPLAAPQATVSDPYALALIANALVAAGPSGRPAATAVLDLLIAQGQTGPEDTLYWSSSLSTWLGASGGVANLETTALAATALLRAGYHTEVAQAAIDYIISQRDSYGGFYTTQATILSLKALLLAAEQAGESGEATVTIMLNGDRAQTIEITNATAEVVQQVRFDDVSEGEQVVTIAVEGDRALLYQVITEHYAPWTEAPTAEEESEAMRIDVAYDRTELQVNDVVNVQAEVELLEAGVAGTVLVDLGVPPGFTPLTEDLDALVEQETIDRYELTGRQILVYLTDVPSGQVITLNYQLLARFPIQAQTPSSQAYDYYTPDKQDTDAPQRIVVKLGTPEND